MRVVRDNSLHTWVVLSSCCAEITSHLQRTESRSWERWTSGPRTGRGNKSQWKGGKWWERVRERKGTSGWNTALEGKLHLAICNASMETLTISVLPQAWIQNIISVLLSEASHLAGITAMTYWGKAVQYATDTWCKKNANMVILKMFCFFK